MLISPHLDDAVLSAGQFLADRPGCDVLTVFAGVPPAGAYLTPYDEKTGFTSSHEAMTARRLEDRDAQALLRAEPIYWDYYDSQYHDAVTEPSQGKLIEDIHALASSYDVVLTCLGLLHPDHRRLSSAVWRACRSLDVQLYLWEDLPNRVLHPEAVPRRLTELGNVQLEAPGGAGPLAEKIRSLVCYRSQLDTGDLDFNVLLVPERFWLMNWKAGDA